VLVPEKCIDFLSVLAHQHQMYRDIAAILLKLPESAIKTRQFTFYISLACYLGNVLDAFVGEVRQEEEKGISSKWRSAHLDYHFALALQNSAFTLPHQKIALKKMNKTWNHFKLKRVYSKIQSRKPVVSMSLLYLRLPHTEYRDIRNVTQSTVHRWRRHVRR
jgi:hypothetical protein